MGHFRFYRRVHVLPGVSVNVSRGGPSLTMGVRGAHVTLGRRGITKTIGLPGTGLFWTESSGRRTGLHSAHADGPVTVAARAAWQLFWLVFFLGALMAGLKACT